MTIDEIIAAVERGETGLNDLVCETVGLEVEYACPDCGRLEYPPVLNSLDAKIPGEDIVCVERMARDRWIAWRINEDRDRVGASGPTEIAARRAAGLRAWKERT